MQFIGFFEYKAEDSAKVIEKLRQRQAEWKKGVEKFVKPVYGPYNFNGERKGFSVYETDNPDDLMSVATFYAPEMVWKFVPLIDSGKGAEIWLKMKK